MNLSDIEATLRNGLHDAILESVKIDYDASTVTLAMRVWIGLLEPSKPLSGRSPVMRRATLRLTGLSYFVIEPPQQLVDTEGGVSVSGDDGESEHPLPALPPDSFRYRFFASDWNSFIHLGARDVRLDWDESEETAWERAKAEE